MCNCYDVIKTKLVDHVAKSAPEGHGAIEVEIQGYLFGLSETGVTHRSSNSVAYSFTAPKKGGGVKKVSKKTFVRATFCPFCGVNYDSEVLEK